LKAQEGKKKNVSVDNSKEDDQESIDSKGQVNFFAGKTFSTFNFINSLGEKSKELSYTNGSNYGFNIGFNLGKRHLLRPEVAYTQAGASSTYMDQPIEWKLNYLGLGLGYLVKVLETKNLTLSPGVVLVNDYLIKGEQIVGDVRYNLNDNVVLKKWDLNAGVLLNARFKVTESLYMGFEYRFNAGLNQIEKQDQGEKTKNIIHKATVGLSFQL
jgi:hypothetical protein